MVFEQLHCRHKFTIDQHGKHELSDAYCQASVAGVMMLLDLLPSGSLKSPTQQRQQFRSPCYLQV